MTWVKISRNENYSINELGQVRNDAKGNLKRPFKNKNTGYWMLDLYKDNKSSKCTIHRLVAEAFIPNIYNKPTVDHIDGNRENNSISNLRWATYSEQNSRFNTFGVRSEKVSVTRFEEFRKKRGGGHIGWGKEIEKFHFNSIGECAKHFECTPGNISLRIKDNKIGRRGITRGYLIKYSQ